MNASRTVAVEPALEYERVRLVEPLDPVLVEDSRDLALHRVREVRMLHVVRAGTFSHALSSGEEDAPGKPCPNVASGPTPEAVSPAHRMLR